MEGPGAGTATGGPSEGPAGAASGATPMEIEEATRETLAEQGEQAAREAAALDERKQKILLAIREHLEDEYGSEMAAEFEVRRRTPTERTASAVELAFQEARAGVRAFAEEKAREQSTIEELKEKTRAAEARLAAADKGLKGQQCEEERLAHEILQSERPEYQAEAAEATMGAKLRREVADRERAEQRCKELEEAARRPPPQVGRGSAPRSWAQVAGGSGNGQAMGRPMQRPTQRPTQRPPVAWRRGPPPVPSTTRFASAETARRLREKHAAPKYVDEEAPLWVVTVQGKDAGASRTKFKKVLDVHLHYHVRRKIVLRSANVVQFAVHPMWWGVAVEAAQLCGWTTIVDVPPWDPAPEEDLSPVAARARGLELWGTALPVEEPRVRQLAAWVRSKAPSEAALSTEMEEDPRPVLTPHSREEGEIVEHPDWTGEQEALPAEKRDREPELQLRLGPVSDDSRQPPPEPRRAIQIKRHRIKEGERPVEMDGTLGDEMVLIDIPDEYYTDSGEEENTPSAKRAVKKAAPKAAAAAPAQAEAAGPPSTEPLVGAEPGESQALVPVCPTSPPTESLMAHEWTATGNFTGGGEEAPMRPAEWRALQAFEPAWRERGERGRGLVMATVNANGLPRETAAEEIGNVMAGLQADILAIQETKLLEEGAEHLRKTLAADKWFSRFSSAAVDEQHRQKGVAVILDPRLALHLLKCEEVRVDGPGEQPPTGTGLRLELRFRQQQVLQLIVVYVPPGSENREVRVRTQQVVRTWLGDAAAANQQAVLLGDFNERIIADGPSSELGRVVANPERWVEAHQTIHGDRGGETAPLRNGTRSGRIDFVFATTGLGPGFVQAAVMESQSGLGEDHRLAVAELATMLLERGQQQPQPPAARQRANWAGASEARLRKFHERMDAWDGPADEMDSVLYQTALEVFGTMAERKQAAIRNCRLSRAGKLTFRLSRRSDGSTGRRRSWGALVVECHEVLPDGLPAEILQECAELAEGDPPAGWQKRMRLLTVYIRRRLGRLRKKEAAGRRFRMILQWVDRRADLMATNIGWMLRSLGRGRLSAPLSRVVDVTQEGTSILTAPDEVERLVSEHFARHFTHPGGEEVEVAGEWSAEYRAAEELPSTLAAPISEAELDEWIARAPKRKAPGPSG
ncbi:hypothetical protein LPJ61_004529, partial [Coemansia biformis]